MVQFTRTMTFQLIKPASCSWPVLDSILRETQSQTWQVLNKTIQLCWEWQGFSSSYNRRTATYPLSQEILGFRGVSGYCYNQLKEQFPLLHTGNLSQTIQRATLQWKASLPAILKGEMSIPSYHRQVPVELHKQSIRIQQEVPGRFLFRLSLLSRQGRKTFGLSTGMLDVWAGAEDKIQRQVLTGILDGSLQQSSAQVSRRKHKWLIHLHYQYTADLTQFQPDRVMGVRVGSSAPLCVAFSHTQDHYIIGEKDIPVLIRMTQRDGKSRFHRTTGNQSSNIYQTLNHRYSRALVELALKYGCGTIQMEEVAASNSHHRFLGRWPYYDWRQKLKYKAEERGIRVHWVKSQSVEDPCGQCGESPMVGEQSMGIFTCATCSNPADLNVARSLALITDDA